MKNINKTSHASPNEQGYSLTSIILIILLAATIAVLSSSAIIKEKQPEPKQPQDNSVIVYGVQ